AACGQPGDDAVAFDAAPDEPAQLDVVAVTVAPAAKGAPLVVMIDIDSSGGAGTARVTPLVTSARFIGFTDVPLGAVAVTLPAHAPARTEVTAGPFLTAADGAHFALGRGDYTISGVRVELDGATATDVDYAGGAFAIAASDVVFPAVVYDAAYFTQIHWTGSPQEYLESAFTRRSELYDPDVNAYHAHAGGFDEMMGIEQRFLALPGLTASETAGGFCEQIGAFARGALGLARDWDIDENQPAWTDAEHHGFDYLVGLTPAMGGGAACGWLGVQVSGLFGFDLSLDRSQIILVHESGHLFGAPHCDPLQGYVMCAGELHDHYRNGGVFVWHQDSRDVMSNRWE
ncbi:MAG TPA: hypothetical protein VIV40_14835, partial [Kofleriaceae bacterium]